jgi:hypothetical protein
MEKINHFETGNGGRKMISYFKNRNGWMKTKTPPLFSFFENGGGRVGVKASL